MLHQVSRAADVLDVISLAVFFSDGVSVSPVNGPARAIEKRFSGGLGGLGGPALLDVVRRVMDSGQVEHLRLRKTSSVIGVTVIPSTDGCVLEARDLSRQSRAGELLDLYQRMTFALIRSNTVSDVVNVVYDIVPSLLGSHVVVFHFFEPIEGVSQTMAAGLPPKRYDQLASNFAWSAAASTWANSETVVALPDAPPAMRGAGIRSAIIAPIIAANRLIGVLLFGYRRARQTFLNQTLQLAGSVATEASVAIDRAELVARLAREALTDTLTGLANLREFEDGLSRQHAQAKRMSRQYSIILADLDNLKRVNDRLGHAAGDAALRSVAHALVVATRSGDLVARVGGDEFAVLLPDADVEGASEVVERIVKAIDHLDATFQGNLLPIGISAGSATFPVDSEETDLLIQIADKRLYQMKEAHHRLRSAESS